MKQIFYVLQLCSFLAYGQSTDLLTFDCQASHSNYSTKTDSTTFYIYLKVAAPPLPDTLPPTPLNIALVLDRSGSMKGAKLQYAKTATNFLIDQLTEKDYLSIIVYDDKVQIIAGSQPVKRKRKWYKLVESIWDDGATNLSGGMFAGFREAKRHFKKGYVNRVLLLSDGLANLGITDPFKLQDTVQYINKHSNITLSTFGLGADFDEDLLEALADKGGANYYFVPKAVHVIDIFKEELMALQSVMAQNASLQLSLPDYLRLDTVYNFPYQLDSNHLQIDLNDIFSQEQKTVLLKLTTIAPKFADTIQLSTHFRYDDILQKRDTQQLIKTIQIFPTQKKAIDSLQQTVLQQLVLFKANDKLSQAIKAVDHKNIYQAKELVKQEAQKLASYLAHYEVDSSLQKQYEHLKAYEIHLQQLDTYSEYNTKLLQKSAKNTNYKIRRKRQ